MQLLIICFLVLMVGIFLIVESCSGKNNLGDASATFMGLAGYILLAFGLFYLGWYLRLYLING